MKLECGGEDKYRYHSIIIFFKPNLATLYIPSVSYTSFAPTLICTIFYLCTFGSHRKNFVEQPILNLCRILNLFSSITLKKVSSIDYKNVFNFLANLSLF